MNITINNDYDLNHVMKLVDESYERAHKYNYISYENVSNEEISDINKNLIGVKISRKKFYVSYYETKLFYRTEFLDWVCTLKNLIACFKISNSVVLNETEAKHLLEIIKYLH